MIATSVFLSLLIALFLPLRPLLRAAIGSQWLCILWLALLMRLLAPWPLQTPWGVMNRWETRSPAISAGPMKVKVSFLPDSPVKESEHPISPGSVAAAKAATSAAGVNILFPVWLAGFLAMLALLTWRGIQTARLAGQTSPVTDERLHAIFSSIPAKWRGRVALRLSPAVQVPTLAGILRPQIWMPPAWLSRFSDEELRCILLHELGHARRGDLAVQWLFAIAECMYWFNPLVWIAARAAQLDREMACDAWVLNRESDASPTYGETLLKTVQMLRVAQQGPATVGMASGRRSLRARVACIGAFRPSQIWRGVLGFALMLAIVAIATSSRTTNGQLPATVPIASPAPAAVMAPRSTSAGPFIQVKATFVEIKGMTWAKLRAENPDLKVATALGPDLDREGVARVDSAPGALPDATSQAALSELGPDQWRLTRGAWQSSHAISVLSVLSKDKSTRILQFLHNHPGSEILSSPMFITASGQRAMIQTVMEYRYPSEFQPDKHSATGWAPSNFAEQDIGTSLESRSTYETSGSLKDTISLNLNPNVTTFLGFLPEKKGAKAVVMKPRFESAPFWRPVFSISTERSQANVQPNQTVLLGGVTVERESSRMDFTQPPRFSGAQDPPQRRILLMLVTASLVGTDGLPLRK